MGDRVPTSIPDPIALFCNPIVRACDSLDGDRTRGSESSSALPTSGSRIQVWFDRIEYTRASKGHSTPGVPAERILVRGEQQGVLVDHSS